MKWFDVAKVPTRDIELAEHCVKYLNRPGEKVEQYEAMRTLRILITKRKIPNNILKDIVSLDMPWLYRRIATFADMEMIIHLINAELEDQVLFSIILTNKLCPKDIEKHIYDKADDSPQGKINKKIIEQRWRKDLKLGK